ncbi:MAG: glycosyltransferase family 4 protein [Ignavibacteria bacterium]|jgi:glycosyltransferase involved in cell wall biosynthesis
MERDKEFLKIAVLFENAFPIADAGANRLISIAKGINELGNDMIIYCVRPAERPPNIINKEVEGVIEGVKYFYPANTTIWPNGKLKRVMIYLKGIFTTWKAIFYLHKTEKVDVIFSYSYGIIINFIFWIFTRIYKIKFVFFVDEYPYSILFPNKFSMLYKLVELKILYKLFDIILVMTSPLKEFYTKRKKRSAVIEIIPMTVQPERFENYVGESPSKKPYFAYAGFLGGSKDGIDILIKAFGLTAKKNTDIFLYIIGYSNNPNDQEKLKTLAIYEGVADKVIFTGKIHRDEIPKYLCNATALVLSRPNNIQAKGGFPTKLGEYLATGNPVIVTSVGEIPYYLQDGVNAFIAEPDSVESFASKMIEVIENPSRARVVGLKGRELTSKVFNNNVQAKRILNFINNLN